MAIWYVKKSDNKIGFIKKMIKPINITKAGNKIIVELPDEKYAKKLEKKIYEKNDQNLVIASDLKPEPFKEICNVLDGRWIFKFLIPEVLEYIEKKAQIELNIQDIAIMVNDNSENTCRLLCNIAQKVKMLNIVTNDIDKFKRLEEYLIENLGIVIRTTNNKKRALLKSSIIFNIDFTEEGLNQYSIPKNSIIININEKISIKSRRFVGINCNYYNVMLPKKYEEWIEESKLKARFDDGVLLESMLYYKKTYESLRDELQNVQIEYLVGNNGRIEEEEYSKINFHKLLDK